MLVIRRLDKELTAQERHPTAEEIGMAMDQTDVERVRSLVSSVNSGDYKYVYTVRLKTKRVPGQPKKRGAPLSTYHLAEMFMVRYPRTGLFLTTAAQFEQNENNQIDEGLFLDHLHRTYGLTAEVLEEDFDWCTKKDYISRFPPKKPKAFQILARTYAEIQWLKTLASEYLRQHGE